MSQSTEEIIRSFNLSTEMRESGHDTFVAYRNLLIERFYTNNMLLSKEAFTCLLVGYGILIIIGVFGNILVCLAFIRNPHMRTARNVYIVNLAVSDLLLCLFTMPFSLIEIALRNWPMGKYCFQCATHHHLIVSTTI